MLVINAAGDAPALAIQMLPFHMRPAYLKIDGTYIRRIADHSEDQFFVKALVTIAHGLDIQVYACHVERKQNFDVIGDLGLDGALGRYIQKENLTRES